MAKFKSLLGVLFGTSLIACLGIGEKSYGGTPSECSQIVQKLGRAIDLSKDEIAVPVKTGAPDPGGDNFYFSGGAKGGATYPVREVLGEEFADKPIIIFRETGHGALYYKGYRFDGVPYFTGQKFGRPTISQGRGLSDGGFAIALQDVPDEVLKKMESNFTKMAAAQSKTGAPGALYGKVTGAVTSASCIKGVCNFVDDSGIDLLSKMSVKEKMFPPEFINYLANNSIKTKAGQTVTLKFFRLNDLSGPEIFSKATASTAGFVKTGKMAGAGLGVIVTGLAGASIWFFSDDGEDPKKTSSKGE